MVTDLDPPQAGGAPVLLFEKLPGQPPVTKPDANHVAYSASMAACVWQAAVVWSIGQKIVIGGDAVTVKVAVQVVVKGAQVLV
jgi:hypothetical protein